MKKKALHRLDNKKYIGRYSKYGLEDLRESVSVHLKTAGIEAGVENILICPGNIQLLYPLYESLMTAGSNFLYEKANLIMTISNIHSIGLNMIPIPLDDCGISAAELEKTVLKCRNAVLHVDPTDHAPTGVVMRKKRKLWSLCRNAGSR